MNNYPDGAANDPNAPWNQKGTDECDECGNQCVDELTPVSVFNGHSEHDEWLCEACCDLAKCTVCDEWRHVVDVVGDVCVDCEEAE